MTSSRTFPNDPAAVRAARKFAMQTLSGHPAELLEVIELLVSELAGNAVRHTDSSFAVRIGADPRRIRISVSDRGPGNPVVRRVAPDAVAGRGLALVEMLSSSWGVRRNRSPARGKTVWFVLELGSREGRPRIAA